MRLLYFINNIVGNGGIERIVIDKINYLTSLNEYEVTLAYYGSGEDVPFYPIDDRVALKSIGHQRMGTSFVKKISSFIHLPRIVNRIIDDTNPDIIINANTILVSWLLPFIHKKIPKIVELHFSYVGMKIISEEMYGNNLLKKRFNYYLRKWGYPLYDRCVLLTNEDKRDWGFKNAVVIPNFTSLHFHSDTKVEKRNVVVNVGRLASPKNQKLLIDSWKIVNQHEPEWQLEIWGDGTLRDNLKNQIISLGLEDSVKLKGVSNHIPDVYQYSSFFVLSSRYEGMPLVMIEALQAGLPCVCCAVNGVRGTIIDDYNGYIVEEMTPNALAEGILKMIQSTRRNDMAKNAIKSSVKYNKDIVMRQWIDLFGSLVKE